jgi:hypothetical protein
MERKGGKKGARFAEEQACIWHSAKPPVRRGVEGGEGGDDLLGFEGDGDDLAYEAEDVAFVVFVVGSLVMPERGSVETRYWSMTHSKAERLPRR